MRRECGPAMRERWSERCAPHLRRSAFRRRFACPLRNRRLELSPSSDRRRHPKNGRRRRCRFRSRSRVRGADPGSRRGHLTRGPVLQRRPSPRFLEVPEPRHRNKPRGEVGSRRTRHRPRRPARCCPQARAHVRPRSGDARAKHTGRDDRQQLLRHARADGR